MNQAKKKALARDEVKPTIDGYTAIYDAGAESRKENYQLFVNRFYDLATVFYEFGWGHSLHFAPRRKGEALKASLLRHQHFLSDRLGLKQGMKVFDVGCGVAGPMAAMARYSRANFVGINNNAYQLERAKHYTRDVESLCSFIHGDYMQIPESDGSFDAAFACEATVHAPDKTALFKEIFRVLRPGGSFASYEWCMTDKFDPGNAEHQRIKNDVMVGDGLPEIAGIAEVRPALEAAGFEVVEAWDRAIDSDPATPWYRALEGRDLNLSSIPRTPIGRALTNLTLRVGESLRVVPKGSTAVSTMLNSAADALVKSGRTGILTPMYFFLARKPK